MNKTSEQAQDEEKNGTLGQGLFANDEAQKSLLLQKPVEFYKNSEIVTQRIKDIEQTCLSKLNNAEAEILKLSIFTSSAKIAVKKLIDSAVNNMLNNKEAESTEDVIKIIQHRSETDKKTQTEIQTLVKNMQEIILVNSILNDSFNRKTSNVELEYGKKIQGKAPNFEDTIFVSDIKKLFNLDKNQVKELTKYIQKEVRAGVANAIGTEEKDRGLEM